MKLHYDVEREKIIFLVEIHGFTIEEAIEELADAIKRSIIFRLSLAFKNKPVTEEDRKKARDSLAEWIPRK